MLNPLSSFEVKQCLYIITLTASGNNPK